MKLSLLFAGILAARAAITPGVLMYGGDESKQLCFDLPGGQTTDGNKFWVW